MEPSEIIRFFEKNFSAVIRVEEAKSSSTISVRISADSSGWEKIDQVVFLSISGYDIKKDEIIEKKNIPVTVGYDGQWVSLGEFENWGIFTVSFSVKYGCCEDPLVVRQEKATLKCGEKPYLSYSFNTPSFFRKEKTVITVNSNCEKIWNKHLWLICDGHAQQLRLYSPETGRHERFFTVFSVNCEKLILKHEFGNMIDLIRIG